MHVLASIATIAFTFAAAMPASAANIVELWDQVKAPPVPKLSPVTVKTSDTALLVLDIQDSGCNEKRRPRCVAAVPAMAAFLQKARSARMPVFHSTAGSATRKNILPPVAPNDDEPIVSASVNKFHGTKLDELLKARNIKTVIVCGTAAFGAVLHTATAAAAHGYKIVLPVDCVPGGSLYEEQMGVWGLIEGPGTVNAVTATSLDAIKIE